MQWIAGMLGRKWHEHYFLPAAIMANSSDGKSYAIIGGIGPATWIGMRPDGIVEFLSRFMGAFSASGAPGATGKIRLQIDQLGFPHRSTATGENRGSGILWILSCAPPGKARSRSGHVALPKFRIFHSEISCPCCLATKFRFDDSEFEPARDCFSFSPVMDPPHARGETIPTTGFPPDVLAV